MHSQNIAVNVLQFLETIKSRKATKWYTYRINIYKKIKNSGKCTCMHLERKIWQILLSHLNNCKHAMV